MRRPDWDGEQTLPTHSIHIGGVFASRTPAVVRTVLGSCISVCLRDPDSRVGGMNHFMLPRGSTENLLATSFGVHAMEMLINEMMKLGADRWNLEAKVFGGGHVLQVAETKENVPASNILFAQNFLKTERIKVLSTDVGGYAAREIFYYTYSGRVGLRRLEATGSGSKKLAEIREDSSPISVRVQSDDDILF